MLTGKLMGAGGAGGVPDNVHLYSGFTVAQGAFFNSTPLGEEHASRHILVGVNSGNANSAAITGVTVAGVTATKLVETSAASTFHNSLWIAAVPTGTSGTVFVASNGTNWNNTSVMALYLSSGTPVATANDINGTTVDVSANVTGPKGVAVGYSGCYNAYTMTPTGFSVQDTLTSNVYDYEMCLADGLVTETPRTLQFGYSGTNNQERGVSATFQGA
jgi:hypothetical protein